MAIQPGTHLGPYEILSAIGAGGMGEVYRARDSKLGRDVAIKVLPEAFARDPERMARFQREARVLASLDHPNIASIYGVEDSGGTRALVMQLVEGPTLADRIKAGPIPIDEALPIAKQICDALEYAHERGIIHRDLKPANVKVTNDDAVKVLDFGLAKALENEGPSLDISTSPTVSRLATMQGVLLGTAAYMSPEQAKGKTVDRRADIWACGCVLYEMLTSKMAFHGEAVTDTLAAVIRAEPDWSALPGGTPIRVRVLLQRCLQKDPKQRLRDIGDARISLDEVLSGAPEALAGVPQISMPPWRRALPWAVTAISVAVAALFSVAYFVRAPKTAPTTVSEISPPLGVRVLGATAGGPPALSPDGQRLAFSAIGDDGRQLLWVRPLNGATAQPLTGTDGAERPFWSPDSRTLGYFANGKLNRIDASGGPPMTLCDAAIGLGGSWGPDGTILFTPNISEPISRVPAFGGTPQPVAKPYESLRQPINAWPQFLPDGRHFLFFLPGLLVVDQGTIYAASVEGSEPRLILRNLSDAIYAPPGYLLFVRDGTLMAQRFDANKLQLASDAVPVAEHVGVYRSAVRGLFTVSDNGILVYQKENAPGGNIELLWFDRNGKRIGKTGSPDNYATISVSPDGSKLATAVIGTVAGTIWIHDVARDVKTRLTFGSFPSGQPSWSPDGKFVGFFSRSSSGVAHLYEQAANGTGSTTPLVVDDAAESYPSWSSDGRYLIFERVAMQPKARQEIWALPLFGDRKDFPVLQGQFDVFWHALSPDGHWLAYTSDETGRPEVYVVPFLHGSGKWLVSTNGGRQPRWRRNGEELFYLSLDDKLMAAQIVETGSSLTISRVQPLFAVNSPDNPGWLYDVSPDGKKFVVVSQGPQQATAPLTLVTNWPSLLKKQ